MTPPSVVLHDGFSVVRDDLFPGGNHADFYAKVGTAPKSEMLARMHPDVARVQWRFNRVHHYVDYGPFKRNRLKRRSDIRIEPGVNDYGMRLRLIEEKDAPSGQG